MKKIIKNIPNTITFSRIISSILAPILLGMGNTSGAIGLYTYGAISDCLDGLAARTLNAHTELGKILDPISDKIYAASLIISSILLGNYLMIIPLVFEGEIAATNIAAKKSGILIRTERVGKYKTALLFISLILGLIAPFYPVMYFPFSITLINTIQFQIQSIHAYENQYHKKMLEKIGYIEKEQNYVKEIEKESPKKEKAKEPIKKVLQDQFVYHYNEFQFYKNIPIESKINKNTKKLQKRLKK